MTNVKCPMSNKSFSTPCLRVSESPSPRVPASPCPRVAHPPLLPFARVFLILALASLGAACSTLQPPDAGGPRSNQPPYPVVLPEDAGRLQQALVLWQRLLPPGSAATAKVNLHPYTATIEGLPPTSNLVLPKVGTNATMSDAETRESLRRFIQQWQDLIGADPNQLSLVELTDQPDGTKLASYEQQPFRYPLRGPYGKLRIRFRPDRRVVDFSSTCIPHADRVQASLTPINPQISWNDGATKVLNLSVPATAGSPQQTAYTITTANKPDVRELVMYAKDPTSERGPLEVHLAWEIAVVKAPFKLVYLDAVNGAVVAVA